MKHNTRIRGVSPPSKRRSYTIMVYCVVLSQLMSNFSPVLGGSDGHYLPPPYQSVSPEMFRTFHHLSPPQFRPQIQIQNFKSRLSGQPDNIMSSSGSIPGESPQSAEMQHKSAENSGKGSETNMSQFESMGEPRYQAANDYSSLLPVILYYQQANGGGGGNIASYGEHHPQSQQQLLPTELLLSQQFPKSPHSMIFNQGNGPFMEKEPLEEGGETNNHLGLFTSYNDYDLSPKQVVVRSRPGGQFLMNPSGPPVKRSQSLAAAREGYMCHFKLCQFGSSGKRRWSPLFEFD